MTRHGNGVAARHPPRRGRGQCQITPGGPHTGGTEGAAAPIVPAPACTRDPTGARGADQPRAPARTTCGGSSRAACAFPSHFPVPDPASGAGSPAEPAGAELVGDARRGEPRSRMGAEAPGMVVSDARTEPGCRGAGLELGGPGDKGGGSRDQSHSTQAQADPLGDSGAAHSQDRHCKAPSPGGSVGGIQEHQSPRSGATNTQTPARSRETASPRARFQKHSRKRPEA